MVVDGIISVGIQTWVVSSSNVVLIVDFICSLSFSGSAFKLSEADSSICVT
jgi:hypothetical protein